MNTKELSQGRKVEGGKKRERERGREGGRVKSKIFLRAECQLINVEKITEIESTIWQLSWKWLIQAGVVNGY